MLGLSKPIITGLAILLALAFLMFAVWLGIHEVRSMINEAATNATAAADAKWTAEIEKSNAEANKKIADQATATLKIQADAADAVNTASQQLEELRKRNAALPDGGTVGLSRDRVQLLPN
jgi:predicted PurR-regulated permease PerM